ncbi:MAG: hypothetical protein AVDCRST_MAG96-1449 [uncultured Segetibacter sp.]|uniref:Uncharacterized protein n=1 Tax=uncultured Segetibacter sp. TaxID=481133 RepID=A0A6J4S598_9BACT|nr:MAG: hypothetical protein AVDCRST_MAG96-1449 [uncultured Segetibacter sp.]
MDVIIIRSKGKYRNVNTGLIFSGAALFRRRTASSEVVTSFEGQTLSVSPFSNTMVL